MKSNKILHGDCIEEMKKIPNENIDMCMTSPPYWALRDYGVKGQLGLEENFDKYIEKLCDVFDEVKRVLKKEGTCWVNLGDTYYTKSGNAFLNDNLNSNARIKQLGLNRANSLRGKGLLASKNLTLVPFRFAIEMQNRGWIIRNVIIWHKPNVMPSSVKDRFTVDFEYLFFFSKNKKYYFETQREPHKNSSIKRTNGKWNGHREPNSSYSGMNIKTMCHPQGRNKRTVWEICPKPFKEAHFAVYPEELCETPIKAGCPEFVCVKCGKPKVKVYEKIGEKKVPPIGGVKKAGGNNLTYSGRDTQNIYDEGKYKPTCDCDAEFISGIVLDPFFGAGTTGLVALKQNKKFIGIELNKEYIKIAEKRLQEVNHGLSNPPTIRI